MLLPGFQEDWSTHKWINNIKNRLLIHPTREQRQKYPHPRKQFLIHCGFTLLSVFWESFLPHFTPQISALHGQECSAEPPAWFRPVQHFCEQQLKLTVKQNIPFPLPAGAAFSSFVIHQSMDFSRNISRCWSRGGCRVGSGRILFRPQTFLFSLSLGSAAPSYSTQNPFFSPWPTEKSTNFSVPFPQEPGRNVGLLVLFTFPPKLGAEGQNL